MYVGKEIIDVVENLKGVL